MNSAAPAILPSTPPVPQTTVAASSNNTDKKKKKKKKKKPSALATTTTAAAAAPSLLSLFGSEKNVKKDDDDDDGDLELKDLVFPNSIPIKPYYGLDGIQLSKNKKKQKAKTNRNKIDETEHKFHTAELSRFFTEKQQMAMNKDQYNLFFKNNDQEEDSGLAVLNDEKAKRNPRAMQLQSQLKNTLKKIRGQGKNIESAEIKSQITQQVMSLHQQASQNMKISKKHKHLKTQYSAMMNNFTRPGGADVHVDPLEKAMYS